MNTLTRKITGLVVGLTVAAASVVALSPGASADVTYPLIGTVNVRSSPSTTATIVTTLSGSQTFNCYLNGTSVNGDVVWGHLANGLGFVSDYYIKEGGKTLAQNGLPTCPGSLTFGVTSGVTIRLLPTTTAGSNGTASGSQTFDCWTTGPAVGGDTVWGRLSNGKGYIPDYNISEGGKTLAQNGLDKCTSVPSGTPTPPPPKTYTFTMSAAVPIRTGPGNSFASNGRVDSGSSQSFTCYVVGEHVGNDIVWGRLANGKGYLPDYYIHENGKNLAGSGLPNCGQPTSNSLTPADAQAYAKTQMSAWGWNTTTQYTCLVTLWNNESGWKYNAINPTSSAYGIPQALPGDKMAAYGADWVTNARTQINWGMWYIKGTYGTPCTALDKWNSRNPHWY